MHHAPKSHPPDSLPEMPSPDDPDDLSATTPLQESAQDIEPLVILSKDKFKLNPPGLASAFAEKHQIASSESLGQFYQFNSQNGLWESRSKAEMRRELSNFIGSLANDYGMPGLRAARTPSALNGILQLIEAYAPIGQLANPQDQLPVANGLLDLSGVTPSLIPFTAQQWCRVKIPYPYEPAAKCPRFLNEFLLPALPDANDVNLIRFLFGAMLLPGNRAQNITLLHGEGGAGKSALVSILEALQPPGRYGYLRSDKLNGRFETHGFHGKSLLVGKDVRADYLNNGGATTLKALTGADRIETEQKFGGRHSMVGQFHVLITSNSRLRLKLEGDESAWRRRLVCFEFQRSVNRSPIPNFDQILLREEGPGILNWLIAGLRYHREELIEHGRVRLTETQQARVDNLLQESDAERSFARASISKTTSTLSVEEIWQSFCHYAHARQWRIPSKQKFCTLLPEIMLEEFGTHRDNHIMRQGAAVRGFKGVGMKLGKNFNSSAQS